ncbi:MAG: hypothetical protein QG632_501 [Candidatus Dependentiae bacterium]|nr:hypothetical protein [Candidatus Dependentiae bacterium]
MQTQPIKKRQQCTAIPIKPLFGYAPFNSPKYSPCGTYYTYIAPTANEGAPTIWIERINGTPEPARPLFPSYSRPITNYQWLHTSRHVAFIRDTNGDEVGHLYICDIETGIVTDASPFDGARILPNYALSPAHPDKIVYQVNRRIVEQYDVVRYCVTTGTWTVLEENPGNVFRWYIDHNLMVRACRVTTANAGFKILTRATIHDAWTTQLHWDANDAFMSRVLSFSPCGRYLYFVDTRNSGTNTLQRLTVSTGVIEVLFNDPEYDIYHETSLSDVLEKTMPATTTMWGSDGSLIGFSYMRTRTTWHFFTQDPTLLPTALHKALTAPEWESWIEYRTQHVIIIGRNSSTNPTEFWRYDNQTTLLTHLGCTRPEILNYECATTIPIKTVTNDGITLHGYLTLPTKRTGKVPLVLKIHGGPWSRDLYGFSSEIQMLASNGFACLQVNYRGSTGYGKNFCAISVKELGGVMVDDVIHFMKDVINNYPIDANRVLYTGRSYGGFSALSVGWKYQDLLKGVVAFVPPTDLSLFLKTFARHWAMASDVYNYRIGHADADAELLHAQSPIAYGHTVKIPTLITYGQTDPRCAPEHVTRYLKVMHQSEHNKILFFEDEGHWVFRENNLLHQWGTILEFIKTHLNAN